MGSSQHFPKRERLVSQKLIDDLFNGSRSAVAFPLRVVYKYKVRAEASEPVQLLVSVPKKHFRHAVDRNRVKRQIREAYRHHKASLYEALPDGQQLLLAFVWLADRHFTTKVVERRVTTLIQQVVEGRGAEEREP